MNKQVIEVELRDVKGRTYLQDRKNAENHQLISKFESRIYEEVGGMLCMYHYHLPECEPVYTRNRWVIKICCCCQRQLDSVEDRLNTVFR
jgi:hypothetical protein